MKTTFSVRVSAGSRRRGFSLLELLVVMGIIALLAGLLVPNMTGIGEGISVRSASQQVSGALKLARQQAMSRNHAVRVRFFRDGAAATDPFNAYEVWEQAATNRTVWMQLSKRRVLPDGSQISADTTRFSSLLGNTTGTTNGLGYSDVTFRANGGTDVPAGNNALTIEEAQGGREGGLVDGLPDNFTVLVVDPFNGKVTKFQP